ncbi:hypothetical protein SAM23877_0335 [Streptomyces ambofaciens ATCC 23877]|uniref:Transposase IS701-like DDE domain-containing protein n=1 Tax=Streptomyces ambofaciens (strain ATCC 23877 / 3486 / DSM 40053 / JCM 4204 / NBRC 12836 / NRRL B-2516) TaxID=278992 RepID=A0A0K2AK63_STRA7|nr:transposase [Streptomyces ambofaciens]AKZ53384.1 hypothetical protein SAM23877_0335 [Streptomyces ambofaciens ATCC 23877]
MRSAYAPWGISPRTTRRTPCATPAPRGRSKKWRIALGLLDPLAAWQLKAPVVVAGAGYGVSTPFRDGLQERGLCSVLAPRCRDCKLRSADTVEALIVRS